MMLMTMKKSKKILQDISIMVFTSTSIISISKIKIHVYDVGYA